METEKETSANITFDTEQKKHTENEKIIETIIAKVIHDFFCITISSFFY